MLGSKAIWGNAFPAISTVHVLQSIGADEVVNYREQDFAELYKDPSKHFDLIVDLIGGEPAGITESFLKYFLPSSPSLSAFAFNYTAGAFCTVLSE